MSIRKIKKRTGLLQHLSVLCKKYSRWEASTEVLDDGNIVMKFRLA